MASYGLYTLLTTTGTATGTELTTGNNDQRTFQAVCTGSGSVTATVILEGSLDKTNWVTIATLSLSGTAPQTSSYEHTSAWTYIRARTSGVSGTSATVNVYVALNRKREERISDSTTLILDAKDFGAKGDGTTDDTDALQAAINTVCTGSSGKSLFVPAGTYRITSALSIPFGQGWRISGEGRLRSVIQQDTANTPIFRFTSSLTHSFTIEEMCFKHTTQQTGGGANPAAVGLYFDTPNSGTIFNFTVQACTFANSYRGLAINESAESVAIWGTSIRDCTFSGTLTGAAVRFKCAVAVGQPNISMDMCYIDAEDATEASIQISAGTQVSLRGVEFNNGTYDTIQQIVIESSTAVSLVGCRCEIPVVSTSGTKTLWSFPNSDVVLVGCQVTGALCSGGGVLQFVSAATGGKLGIFGMQCGGTRADGGSLVPFVASTTEAVLGLALSGGWVLNPRGVLGNVDMPRLYPIVMTPDATQTRGDVSVTLSATDYRVQYFNTTLTANRTCTLPSSGLQDGMEFHIVRYAATPGAFTLQVVDGVSGKSYTIASGTKGFARYRAVGTGEWLLIEAGTFP